MKPKQSRIVDQHGQPIDIGAIREPQTSQVAALRHAWVQSGATAGLSPARLSAALRGADEGDLMRQHELFDDMIERDAHLAAEMGKRNNAPLTVDWSIKPPRNPSSAETKAAEWVEELIRDALELDDVILALMEGVGHGFGPVEMAWSYQGGENLPTFEPIPQSWFQLDERRKALTLRDGTAYGAALQPFGWIVHQPRRAKTGYLGRIGLMRTLAWPFLYKAYALGDFAEFLETYGLPLIMGKYYPGAPQEDKDSLLAAVAALGHDARGIMPADMELEIHSITSSGSGQSAHMAMVEWADKAQSKAILGGTLTSQADGKTSTNALGNVHNEVRADILTADTRQLAATLTQQLIYPLIALNIGGVDSIRRCPRLEFDTEGAEDLERLATSLPPLVALGVRIPRDYVNDKAKIPLPADGDEVLAAATPEAPPVPPNDQGKGKPPGSEKPTDKPAALRTAVLRALSAMPAAGVDVETFADQTALDAALEKLPPEALAAQAETMLMPVLDALGAEMDIDAAMSKLASLYPTADSARLEDMLGRAIFVAETWGRLSAGAENPPTA